jgi:hypothetical protein
LLKERHHVQLLWRDLQPADCLRCRKTFALITDVTLSRTIFIFLALNASEKRIAQFRAFNRIGGETRAIIHTHFHTIAGVVVVAVLIAGAAFKTHTFGRTDSKITVFIFQAVNASENRVAQFLTFQISGINTHTIGTARFYAGAYVAIIAFLIAGTHTANAHAFGTAGSKRAVVILQTFNASKNRIARFRTFQSLGLGALAVVRACFHAGADAVVVAVFIAGTTTGKALASATTGSNRTVLIC